MYAEDANKPSISPEKELEEEVIDIRQSVHLRAKEFYGDDSDGEPTLDTETEPIEPKEDPKRISVQKK